MTPLMPMPPADPMMGGMLQTQPTPVRPELGDLLVPGQGPGGPQASAADKTTETIMTQIGQWSTGVEDLARQFPWTSAEARAAGDALMKLGMAAVRGLSGPGSEPQGPRTLA
jgi:hypothetical protein